MDKQQERYEELIRIVNAARPLYMQGKDTGISDEVYDSYMREIYEYEAEHYAASNSPTQSINPDLGDGDVRHPYRMLSLLDVFTPEDAQDFIRKHRTPVSVEYKIDGLSVQLIYRDGKLVSASTRGDGEVGVECLEAATYIRAIPKEIGVSGEVIVRGEVFMTKASFEDYCKVYGKQANPRNTAVGIFKRKAETHRARYLDFKAFNLENADARRDEIAEASAFWGADTHGLCLERMAMWGFNVVKHWAVTDAGSLPEIIDEVRKNREEEDVPIDGLVIKIDDLNLRKKLGDNGKIPHWAVAYKFPAQEQETDLLDIEWQVGATGGLTPVAILKPVSVMGSTITKATLHNRNRIKELGLEIGDKVVVYKSGDIIPAIKSTRHTESSKPIEFPTVCPACGAKLVSDGVKDSCTNIECREKVLARLNAWTDKRIANFKGVAGSLVTALFERGKLRIPSDFYLKVKPIDIMTLPGQGRAKMNTYMQRVSESVTAMTFAQVLVGLGINNLAQAGAAEVEKVFRAQHAGCTFQQGLEMFQKMDEPRLKAILGNAKGSSVYQQLQEPFIQEVIVGIGVVFKNRTF